MKLTNIIRDAFIRAAMNDVPKVDYAELARAIALKHIEKSFTATFPGVDFVKAAQSGWLERVSVKMPSQLENLYTYAPSFLVLQDEPKVWAKLSELNEKAIAQRHQRDGLQSKLRAVAYSCTTRKALAEALPEFAKYLPADEPAAIRTLPAVTNVVADFVKAGWPANDRKAKAAA